MPSLVVAGFTIIPLITILSDTGADVSIDGMDFFLFRVLPSSELPAPFLLTVNPGRVVDSNIAPYALPTIQIAVDIAHPRLRLIPFRMNSAGRKLNSSDRYLCIGPVDRHHCRHAISNGTFDHWRIPFEVL